MDPIQVRIRNFQSIEQVEFVIHGMTCIVGKTNIGKSATLRSIASAILNKPVTNMIRHGEKSCTVELHTDRWGFKWEKGQGINRYTLDGKDEQLDNVGRGQIEEITGYGFGRIKVGEDKYLTPWYANQYESVFLLNQSGPDITDFISKVSRLDVLQKGIVHLNKERRRFKDKVKLVEADIQQIQDKQKKIERLPEMRQVQNELRLQFESIRQYAETIQGMERLQARILKLSDEISILENIQGTKIPKAPDTQVLERLKGLYKYKVRLERGALSILSIRAIDQVKIPEIPELPDVKRLVQAQKLLQRKLKLEKLVSSVQADIHIPSPPIDSIPPRLKQGLRLLRQIQALQERIEADETRQKQMELRLSALDEQIASIPKCPTCSRPWSNGAGNHSHSIDITL